MRTALTLAGLALVLGGLAGCGSDDDGESDAAAAPENASVDDFCTKFNGLYDKLFSGDLSSVKDWAADMADVGTPGDMPDDARKGYEVMIATIKGLDDNLSLEDFQSLGDDLSAADNEAVDAFGDWTTDTCPEPDLDLPSIDPSDLPSIDPSDMPTDPAELESMMSELSESLGG